MFSIEDIKAHLRLIHEGTNAQLDVRESEYVRLIQCLDQSSDLRKDMQFLLRKLRDEKAARLELSALIRPKSERH